MVKVIKKPLTDRNGYDVFTGKYVGSQLSFDLQESMKAMADKFNKKLEESEDGKVRVEGLGFVS